MFIIIFLNGDIIIHYIDNYFSVDDIFEDHGIDENKRYKHKIQDR